MIFVLSFSVNEPSPCLILNGLGMMEMVFSILIRFEKIKKIERIRRIILNFISGSDIKFKIYKCKYMINLCAKPKKFMLKTP
jgi:hypothetical protein